MSLNNLAGFDWNKANKYKNLIKHKVSYKECEEAFLNQSVPVYPDFKHSTGEKRFYILSQTSKKRKLFISFTIRRNKIRVISARDMNKKERRIYAQKT